VATSSLIDHLPSSVVWARGNPDFDGLRRKNRTIATGSAASGKRAASGQTQPAAKTTGLAWAAAVGISI